MRDIYTVIEERGIVPIIPRCKSAVALVDALAKGGLPLALIDLRAGMDDADMLRAIGRARPGIALGAIISDDRDTANAAIEAGSSFIVTDGCYAGLSSRLAQDDTRIIPTCIDVQQASMPGNARIKMIAMPTRAGFLEIYKYREGNAPEAIAHIDRDIASPERLAADGCDGIAEAAREAVLAGIAFEPYHVGLNSADRDEALVFATRFGTLFALPMTETHRSFLLGDLAEVMMLPYLGEHGHIGIRTASIRRAMAYLADRGAVFRMNTYEEDAAGRPVIVYLEEEIAGFAIHLTQKNERRSS